MGRESPPCSLMHKSITYLCSIALVPSIGMGILTGVKHALTVKQLGDINGNTD